MKQSYRILIIFLLPLLALTGLKAQNCDWRELPGVSGQPSVLELVTGRYEVSLGRELIMEREDGFPSFWLGWPLEALPLDSVNIRARIFQTAWDGLSDWRFTDGGGGNCYPPDSLGMHVFAMAGYGLNEDTDCGLRFFRLTGSYLQSYHEGTPPLFPNFNGGFHNYLKDSLFWGNADTADYDRALASVMEMVQLTRTSNPTFLELMGDLLVQHRDPFVANYFAYLAYMRASLLSEGASAAQFERKAIFALEAPRTSEDRFNRYRYTQLRKALEKDIRKVGVADKTPELPPSPPVRFFPDSYDGRLMGMLEKSEEQLAQRRDRQLTFADEVDRGDVKRSTRFNVYALFLIAVIIGAVVFFWIRLRRASRTR